MKVVQRVFVGAAAAAVIAGCGGSGGATPAPRAPVPTAVSILARAPLAGQAQGIRQLAGFVGEAPAFLTYVDTLKWRLSVVGAPAVDLDTSGFANARMSEFDNGFVVGNFDGGTFVYRNLGSGWAATTFPGLNTSALDGATGKLIGHKNGAVVAVDIQTKQQKAVPIPVQAHLHLAKANWLVYSTTQPVTTFFVRSLTTGEQWQSQAVPGDTKAFPYEMNSQGGVLGNSDGGQIGRAVYWAPGTGAARVIGSFPESTVEPGWVSPDGTRFIVNVFTTNRFRSYFYIDGVQRPVSDLQGGDSVSYLFHLNDPGDKGFAFTDQAADPKSLAAVGITYR